MPSGKTPKKKAAPKTSKSSKSAAKTKPRAAAKLGPSVKLSVDISDLIDQLRRPQPEFRISVRRPDDMVVFDLIFYNLKLVSGAKPKLTRGDPKTASYFAVEFPQPAKRLLGVRLQYTFLTERHSSNFARPCGHME